MYRIAILFPWLLMPCSPAHGDELGDAVRRAVTIADPSVVRLLVIGGEQTVDGEKVSSLITTGVVVSADGEILTSQFALKGNPESVLAEDRDGQRTAVEIIATDHVRRLVLLKARGGRWIPVTAVGDSVQVGQWSIALGRFYTANASNVSVGIVSALNRVHGMAIQTDAKISPVNYGGPLINLEGEVLGILVPLSPRGQGSSTSGIEWYDSGIGFAVPMEDALRIAERLRSAKELQPGRLGLKLVAAGMFSSEVRIARVISGSPADLAGLRKDDQIVSVNGRPVERASVLEETLAGRYAGDSITLELKRGSETVAATAELVEQLPVVTPGYLGFMTVRTARPTESREPPDAGTIARLLQPDDPSPPEKAQPEPHAQPDPADQSDSVPLLVVNKSPAAKAGLDGRVEILRINAVTTASFGELQVALDEVVEGTTVVVEYHAAGDAEVKTAEIVAEARPERVTRLSDDFLLAIDAVGKAAQQALSAIADQAEAAAATESPPTSDVQRREMSFDDRGRGVVFSGTTSGGILPGVVILLSAHGVSEEEILRQWKPVLDSHKLVVAVPINPENTVLTADDIPLVMTTIQRLAAGSKADLRRIALVADRSQSDLAWQIVFGSSSPIRGIALTNGWISSSDARTANGKGHSVLLLESPQNAQSAALLTLSRDELRKAGFWAAMPADNNPIREIADWSLLLRAF